MKKLRFSEEQIIGLLKQQVGRPAAEIGRRHGTDARHLNALDDENRKLKKISAEAVLDLATLREALGENL